MLLSTSENFLQSTFGIKLSLLPLIKAMTSQFLWCLNLVSSSRLSPCMLLTVWTNNWTIVLLYSQPWNKSASHWDSLMSPVVLPPHVPLLGLGQHISSSVVGLLVFRSPSHTLQRPLSLLHNSLAGWIKEPADPVAFHGVYNLQWQQERKETRVKVWSGWH